MSTLHWLASGGFGDSFPPASEALDEPNGLLAAGGDLEPQRVLQAYRHGIFPWYESGQPILWWSPDPRTVLWPADLHISRSLRKRLHQGAFTITVNTAFKRVVAGCAAPRRYTEATWITIEMARAYTRLHQLGWAHSFEAWQAGSLVGGLYGVWIGRVFFGESMFSHVTDASKVAFVHAVRHLVDNGIALIDCQVGSPHLESLGATELSRTDFLARVHELCEAER